MKYIVLLTTLSVIGSCRAADNFSADFSYEVELVSEKNAKPTVLAEVKASRGGKTFLTTYPCNFPIFKRALSEERVVLNDVQLELMKKQLAAEKKALEASGLVRLPESRLEVMHQAYDLDPIAFMNDEAHRKDVLKYLSDFMAQSTVVVEPNLWEGKGGHDYTKLMNFEVDPNNFLKNIFMSDEMLSELYDEHIAEPAGIQIGIMCWAVRTVQLYELAAEYAPAEWRNEGQ